MTMTRVTTILALLLLFATNASAEEVLYLHTDALGSVVVITDENANVVERREYEPYGLPTTPIADGPGFTGHDMDGESGLVYMQQRYYDPMVGQFLSVDPMAVDTATAWNFNRYHYAASNPYKYTDSDGRVIDLVVDIAFIGYSAYTLATDPSWTNAAALGADIVGAAVPGVTGLGVAVRSSKMADDAAQTITRYMGPDEAATAAREGAIPNVGPDGMPRPTHVTTDAPTASATEATKRYELGSSPTHSATVPANRVSDLGPAPDGRSTTSGGGSQNATNQPVPVRPDEIRKLDP